MVKNGKLQMKIRIDNSKCKSSEGCRICVQICPSKVFVLKPIKGKTGTFMGEVEIKALFKDFCNGCRECVEMCPEKCIKIDF